MGNATGRWLAALGALVCACLWLDFRHIAETLPYPQHIDEPALSNTAVRMLTTGSLHPSEFNYPSLAKYLTAVGMALGLLRSAGALGVHEVARIGGVAFPFYNVPEVVQGARQLFALSAAAALFATGIAAFEAFRRPSTLVLAPLALALTPLFFLDSWSYLNVDIVSTCFVALTLAACLMATRVVSFARIALVPGCFAGFAASSKYTLGVVIVPALVAIALFAPRGRRIGYALAAIASMGVAFLVTMPYALLDIPGTLNGLAFDAYHYASGHAGVDVEPGFQQVLGYTRDLVQELGLPGLVFAEVGLCAFLVTDTRRALVLAAFPAVLLRMLVTSRVHFERNALPLLPVVAMFAAYGVVRCHGWAATWLERRGLGVRLRGEALAGVLVLASVPFWRARDWVRDWTDSRTLGQRWIESNVPTGTTVVVPSELHLKPELIAKRARTVDCANVHDARELNALLASLPRPAVVLWPRWGADPRFPGQGHADAMNRAGRGLHVLQSFGQYPLLVNYPETAPMGDPQFVVARVEKADRR